jgi:hypothetical protein
VVDILRTVKQEIEPGRFAVHVDDDRAVLATFPDLFRRIDKQWAITRSDKALR